jgi:hypothetical protein
MQHRPRISNHDRPLRNHPPSTYIVLRRGVGVTQSEGSQPSETFFQASIDVRKVWTVGEGRKAGGGRRGRTAFGVEFGVSTSLDEMVEEEGEEV